MRQGFAAFPLPQDTGLDTASGIGDTRRVKTRREPVSDPAGDRVQIENPLALTAHHMGELDL